MTTNKAGEDTQEKHSELEDAKAALRAEDSIRAQERMGLRTEGAGHRTRKEIAAEEPHRTRRNRKDGIREVTKRRYNKMIT